MPFNCLAVSLQFGLVPTLLFVFYCCFPNGASIACCGCQVNGLCHEMSAMVLLIHSSKRAVRGRVYVFTDLLSRCTDIGSSFFQVMYGNDTAVVQLEQRKKSWPNYTLKALLFACAMFSAYMNISSSASITIKILFVVDIIVFTIINGVLYINLPDWGNALVCISCLLLQAALCLLAVRFNGCCALAILVIVLLILIVTLQPKFQHSVKKYVLPSFTTDDGNTQNIGDQENHYLNHLFDISNDITTCGGLATGIMGYYYMEGPVTAAGFFFFSTVLLRLYLMMAIAMRAVSPRHAACLDIVLKVLLLLTIITASISFVHHQATNPQVVK